MTFLINQFTPLYGHYLLVLMQDGKPHFREQLIPALMKITSDLHSINRLHLVHPAEAEAMRAEVVVVEVAVQPPFLQKREKNRDRLMR